MRQTQTRSSPTPQNKLGVVLPKDVRRLYADILSIKIKYNSLNLTLWFFLAQIPTWCRCIIRLHINYKHSQLGLSYISFHSGSGRESNYDIDTTKSTNQSISTVPRHFIITALVNSPCLHLQIGLSSGPTSQSVFAPQAAQISSRPNRRQF